MSANEIDPHTYDGHCPICAGSCGFNPEPTDSLPECNCAPGTDGVVIHNPWAHQSSEPESPADVEIRSE